MLWLMNRILILDFDFVGSWSEAMWTNWENTREAAIRFINCIVYKADGDKFSFRSNNLDLETPWV